MHDMPCCWWPVGVRGVEDRAVSEFAGYISRLDATPKVGMPEYVATPPPQVGKRTRVESEGVGRSSSSPAASPAGQLAEPANEWRPDDALSFGPPAHVA